MARNLCFFHSASSKETVRPIRENLWLPTCIRFPTAKFGAATEQDEASVINWPAPASVLTRVQTDYSTSLLLTSRRAYLSTRSRVLLMRAAHQEPWFGCSGLLGQWTETNTLRMTDLVATTDAHHFRVQKPDQNRNNINFSQLIVITVSGATNHIQLLRTWTSDKFIWRQHWSEHLVSHELLLISLMSKNRSVGNK